MEIFCLNGEEIKRQIVNNLLQTNELKMPDVIDYLKYLDTLNTGELVVILLESHISNEEKNFESRPELKVNGRNISNN